MRGDGHLEKSTDYKVWTSLVYEPSITAHHPLNFVDSLAPGCRILEIGCGKGEVSLMLANRGFRVIGVDINPVAIAHARSSAKANSYHDLEFLEGDALELSLGLFDAIVAIRIFTCIPSEDDRIRLARKLVSSLKTNGLLYVHDFLRHEKSSQYAERYKQGRKAGLSDGNFTVPDGGDDVLFIAHHFRTGEIASLFSPLKSISFEGHISKSMRGNEAKMFKFIGEKNSAELVTK